MGRRLRSHGALGWKQSVFGDCQLNAIASFEAWNQPRPPVVATLLRFGAGTSKVRFRIDLALPYKGAVFEIRAGGSSQTLTVTQESSGDWLSEWTPPASLGWDSPTSQSVALIHPQGWADWFPLWFRMPVWPISDLLATVPAPMRVFPDGGGIVDHEHVSAQTQASSRYRVHHLEDGTQVSAKGLQDEFNALGPALGSPFQQLIRHDFAGRYNQKPYTPGDIHARYPFGGQMIVTGVGQGWTWVNQPQAPFKIMYTCFQRRQRDAEGSAPDGGVASGGGWHLIGDPAETILNDLEAGPLVVASAMGNPYPAGQLPSGGFSYNLSDVASIRFLNPGEAFVTRRGSASQPNYHWYFFNQPKEVCTEEWVHPRVPNDRYDF